MSICVFLNSKKLPSRQNIAVFGQDICNVHGFKCTYTNIRISLLKTMIFGGTDFEGVICAYLKRIGNKP